MNMEKLAKSPLNFVGGKYKLLPQILPLFPSGINRFVDLFGGGFNVGVNVNANEILYNDTEYELTKLIRHLYHKPLEESLTLIDELIIEYSLNKSNKEGYLKLRKNYNNGLRHPLYLYVLIAHAFSNQIRFNKKGEFNMPFGERTFNNQLRSRFVNFVKELRKKEVEFTSFDFRLLKGNVPLLKSNDFVYCDPPYLIGTATYNEQGGWTIEDEKDLYELLDKLNENNIKFALSNVFESKGKSNEILKEWSNKYTVHHLNYHYASCNYQTKNRDKSSTDEVLVTNY